MGFIKYDKQKVYINIHIVNIYAVYHKDLFLE